MTAPSTRPAVTSLTVWWEERPGPARVILAVVAASIGIVAGLAALDTVTGGPAPGGPASSSYATGADGLAAYARLVADAGHRVVRLRTAVDESRLDSADTLVIADPEQLSSKEEAAVERFVEGGGRLVAAGTGAAPTGRRIAGAGFSWSASPAGERVLVPVPEVAGLRAVSSAGQGSWSDTAAALPVMGEPGHVLIALATVGSGRAILVADASVLQNARLAQDDNAAFALDAAGSPNRPVLFAEHAHGYTTARGLGAIPRRWRWLAALSVVAVVVVMWAKGRRFGPAEADGRELPPPRRLYVDAVAATLAKTSRRADAAGAVRQAARQRVLSRAGLDDEAPAAVVRAAARRMGLDEAEAGALTRPAVDDDDVLTLGRAFAKLEKGAR